MRDRESEAGKGKVSIEEECQGHGCGPLGSILLGPLHVCARCPAGFSLPLVEDHLLERGRALEVRA